jgi:hypothetical protein
MRDGRSAPRAFCIKCQVNAMVEPPARIGLARFGPAAIH